MRLSRTAFSPLLSVMALAAVFLSLAGCASSQDTAREEGRIALLVADINAAVDLTDVQAERVHEILVAAEANRASGPPPRGAQQRGQGGPPPGGDRDAQRTEVDRQIEAVLTDDQVDAFRAWRASQPQRPQGPPPRRQ